MMQLQEFINQLPPGEQARVRRLLQEYNSAVNPQDRALAQRRLEPYTRAMIQSPDFTGTRNFLDRAAREKYLKNTIGREISKPIAAEFSGSNLTPDKLIQSGIPGKPTTLGDRFPLENREKLPPLRIAESPPMAQMGPPSTAGPTARIADTSSFNYGKFPVNPASSAVQPTAVPPSLLDPETEETSLFDDPMRMGLLQAGLGLMSAPRYSTNPNDVTLSSGLARGLGGFIEGYGGTRQRLTEEERQRLDDEFKRQQMAKEAEYKDALIKMYGIQGEAQRKTADLNATEKLLEKNAINAQVKRILEFEGKTTNKTRQIELTQLAKTQPDVFADLYRESTTDRAEMEQTLVDSGKYTIKDAEGLTFKALESQYEKTLELKTDPKISTSQGSERERYNADLQKVIEDPSLLNTPFHESAWVLYYQNELDAKLSDNLVMTKPSIYPVPEKYKYLFEGGKVEGQKRDDLGGFFTTSRPSSAQSKQLNSALSDLAAVQKVEDQVKKIGVPNFKSRLTQADPEVARLAAQYGNMLMQLKESYNLGVLQELDKQEMQNIINNPTDPKSIRNTLRTVPLFIEQSNVVKEAILNRNRPLAKSFNIDLESRFAKTYPGMNLTFDIPSDLPRSQSKLDKRTDDILETNPTSVVEPVDVNNGNNSNPNFFERVYNNLTN